MKTVTILAVLLSVILMAASGIQQARAQANTRDALNTAQEWKKVAERWEYIAAQWEAEARKCR